MTERKPSIPALWCLRIATFLIAYFIVVVLGHRWQIIETISVFWLLGLGLLMILTVVGLGIIGLTQLWRFGHIGGKKAVAGIILAAIMVTPFAWYGWLSIKFPVLYDITTDRIVPPAFEASLVSRLAGMNDIITISPENLEIQFLAYPKVGPRRFATTADRIYSVIISLMKDRGWKIVAEDVPEDVDPVDVQGSAKKHPDQAQASVPASKPEIPTGPAENPPDVDPENSIKLTYVETVARSFIFAFESEVIVRMIEQDGITRVDMRSASRWGPHDFGSNAKRIESFLSDLDQALAGIAGEG